MQDIRQPSIPPMRMALLSYPPTAPQQKARYFGNGLFCLKVPIVFRIGERLEEGDKRRLILLTQIEPTLGMLRQVGG
jgi:hypothetical protein